jgi:hypothetical protein
MLPTTVAATAATPADCNFLRYVAKRRRDVAKIKTQREAAAQRFAPARFAAAKEEIRGPGVSLPG